MNIYIDEAWRWPIAWPLVIWFILEKKEIDNIWYCDSKKISEKKRELFFEQIKNLKEQNIISYEYIQIDNNNIDKYWLSSSLKYWIIKWIKKILKKNNLEIDEIESIIFDWNCDFWVSKDIGKKIDTIKKADEKIFQVSMASIIAKVIRDRIMVKNSKKYNYYNFEKNKWYWTKEHKEAIKKHWISNLHRKSFIKN